MAGQFKAFNGPAPTAAQQLAVTTGTAIKTMMQLATPSTTGLWIKAWGVTHDGAASTTSMSVELISHATGGATVTAYAAGDITQFGPNDEASQVTVSGTTNGGYTGTNEQTLTAVDVLDSCYLVPTQADRYVFQWPLGERPFIAVSRWIRIRVTAAGAATNMRCWIEWLE